MKTAFVLAGGGAAGSFQCGALKAMHEANIKPDLITGNSAGALNAVGLTYGNAIELEKLWRSIKHRKDVFRKTSPGWWRYLRGKTSLYDSKPLRQMIQQITNGRAPKIPTIVNTVSLKTGIMRRARSTDKDFLDMAVASASIPIITEPVHGEWVDGAIRENTPLRPAIMEGATRIYMFINSKRDRNFPLPKIPKLKNMAHVVERTLGVISDEHYWEDVEYCELNNKIGDTEIEIKIIYPPHEIIGMLDFEPEKIAKAIDAGYNWTKANLDLWAI